MKVIYKYPLEVDVCTIELPVFCKVVCVHEQNGVPTLWIEQDTKLRTVDTTFYVVGTGQELPDAAYVGTCFIGSYVWHVYKKYSLS